MPVVIALIAALLASSAFAQPPVVRTADPAKRGLKESDFPRTIKVADNVYTYEDFHAGPEKFTTTNMFVVTDEGVLVADGQGSPAETKGLVEAIRKITPKPIKYVVICSDHGDHTGGNSSFPPDVKHVIRPQPKGQRDQQPARAASAGRSGRGSATPWVLPNDAGLVFERKAYVLGGQEIQILFLGRAHTGGDLSVYLPQQKILFL